MTEDLESSREHPLRKRPAPKRRPPAAPAAARPVLPGLDNTPPAGNTAPAPTAPRSDSRAAARRRDALGAPPTFTVTLKVRPRRHPNPPFGELSRLGQAPFWERAFHLVRAFNDPKLEVVAVLSAVRDGAAEEDALAGIGQDEAESAVTGPGTEHPGEASAADGTDDPGLDAAEDEEDDE